ncbi:MAG: TetR/AcrR family transcriptional regulator [Deltaproteobacteria bacterium]|nr:TetR/AcrR family transcriptional regulator [Deltaproteobacteria bacterium]
MGVIAAEGSRKFTAKLVGARIGVTAGAIYRHFPSMDAIIDAVIDRVESLLFQGFPPNARDPIERLGLFFRGRVQTIASNPDVSRMLMSDHLAHAAGPRRAARIEGFKRRSRRFVVGSLREAAENGSLARSVRPDDGAIIVLGSILRLAHVTPPVGRPTGVMAQSERVWSVLEGALRRPGSAARTPRARPRRRGRTAGRG